MEIKKLTFSPNNCPQDYSIETEPHNTEIVAHNGKGATSIETSFSCPVRDKQVIFRMNGRYTPPIQSCEGLNDDCNSKNHSK